MKKTMTVLTAIALAFTCQAYATPLKPAKCPSPAIIYKSPFTLINARLEGSLWTVLGNSDNQYGTADHWFFMVTRINAFTRQKAFELAVASLSSLGNPQGPTYSESNARWACQYITAQGYYAYAMTPL